MNQTSIGSFAREDPKNVQFYSEHAQKLLQSQKHKIKKFIEHECIEYVGDGVYACKPIPGYNKTTHKLTKNPEGGWECTCQHYRMEMTNCSHIGALYEYFARGQKYD